MIAYKDCASALAWLPVLVQDLMIISSALSGRPVQTIPAIEQRYAAAELTSGCAFMGLWQHGHAENCVCGLGFQWQ